MRDTGLCSLLCAILFLSTNFFSADSTSKCLTCNNLTNRFTEGLEKTEKSNFGGGNTHWEERKLGSFLYSETRLLEILDHTCADTSKSECHLMVEENEEVIEKWWFTLYAKGFDTSLNTYLCIDSLKVCCPNGTYGTDCVDCPGGADRPCNGNGHCLGSGTRDGSGMCSCNAGYRGDLCNDCNDGYFEDSRNEALVVCKACHKACNATCQGEEPTDCDSCATGWVHQEDNMCVDVNECETSPCAHGKYCENNEGFYLCNDCHRACNGCTDAGSESCIECSAGYWRDTSGCEACHESCLTSCTDSSPSTCDDCSVGWKHIDGICQDIDECVTDGVCANNTFCLNNPGSYSCPACHTTCQGCTGLLPKDCIKCKIGYIKNADNECIDVDECIVEQSVCRGANEKCINTIGGYKCNCQDGYKRVQRQCQPKNSKSKKKIKPQSLKEMSSDDQVVQAASKILGEPLPHSQGQPIDISDEMIVMEGNFDIPPQADSNNEPKSQSRDDL